MKPLNEDFLWKGKIQLASYPPPDRKQEMNLPKYNLLTGKPPPNTIPEDMQKSWVAMSSAYWYGVKRRQEAYREKHRVVDHRAHCLYDSTS
jgi:hypothetical protein